MSRTYQLGIVGEANYQSAIQRCSAGQAVEIVHEPDNPHDEHALAVITLDGQTIGYIPRACWLQDAIHDEGKGCDATIKSINTAAQGILGVVLDVTLNLRGLSERAFSRTRREQAVMATAVPPKGWLGRIFGL